MAKQECVLVTGASGFIGGKIAVELCQRGYRVRAQYRRPDLTGDLQHAGVLGAELVRIDLTQEPLHDLTDGVDYVIHAAAMVQPVGPISRFAEINVVSTQRLLQSAKSAGCRKFVYISSMTIHGFGEHVDSDETGPYFRLISAYQRTKKQAENFVMAQSCPDMPCTSVRPGLVFGPGDTAILKRVFDLLSAGRLPLIGGFQVLNCPIFIDDLVEVIIRAMELDASNGEIFNVSRGEKIILRTAVENACELFDRPLPRLNIPRGLVMFASTFVDTVFTLLRLRGTPALSKFLALQLCTNFHFSAEKTERLLGFCVDSPWEEQLKLTVEAYKTQYMDA